MASAYNVFALYISPTGNTLKATRAIAKGIADMLSGGDFFSIDLTAKSDRFSVYDFGPDDIVVLGTPVYAGRVPNKLAPYIAENIYCSTASASALAIPLVTYGNRAYDDSLKELATILYENGFDIGGAAAVPSEHAFTDRLAKGRPTENDLNTLYEYGKTIAGKITHGNSKSKSVLSLDALPGHSLEDAVYYTPLNEDMTPANFLKAKPETDSEKCSSCGLCRTLCPMGCYDNSLTQAEGICIKCQACIKSCPANAKFLNNDSFASHVKMLEQNYSDIVREIELF